MKIQSYQLRGKEIGSSFLSLNYGTGAHGYRSLGSVICTQLVKQNRKNLLM